MPPSGGGRRALFSPADGLLARAALRPGVPPCALWCPCALWDAPVHPVVSCVLWGGPVRPAVPCAPWDALCALRCPVRSGVPPCGLRCPHVACDAPMRPCGAPCAPWGYPTRSALPCAPPSALRRIAPRNTERASPLPRNNSLPRPAAVLSPAPPHGREKARPLLLERPGLVHFAVRR